MRQILESAMRCPLCTAVHVPATQQFIVSYGPPMSEVKLNSRCCHYARQRGKEGCINPCRVVDARETLEGRLEALEAMPIHPEIREVFIPSFHD
jgi:hypothetical protein